MTTSAPHGYVTSPGWFVSSISPYDGGARLSVSRVDPRQPGSYRTLDGDHAGRIFATSKAAHAFAADRGYLMPYVPSGAAWRACNRLALRQWGRSMARVIREAPDRAALDGLADAYRAWAMREGCALLDASRYALAPYAIARRIRPDLTT